MEMLFLGLVKLLGSAGFGTIFGGVMGLLNRREDLRVKQLELEDRQRQRGFELAMRDKDAAIMAQEWAARTKVAQIEGEARVEGEAYAALAKSYEFAKPQPGSRMESFSAFMRPFMSGGYFVFSTIGCGWIVWYAFKVVGVTFTTAQWYELVMFVLAWFFFMAGSAIGWWYAMRSGKAPPSLAAK
jgi:hypothetical protein